MAKQIHLVNDDGYTVCSKFTMRVRPYRGIHMELEGSLKVTNCDDCRRMV